MTSRQWRVKTAGIAGGACGRDWTVDGVVFGEAHQGRAVGQFRSLDVDKGKEGAVIYHKFGEWQWRRWGPYPVDSVGRSCVRGRIVFHHGGQEDRNWDCRSKRNARC